MTDDELIAWASKASSEIVKREGAAWLCLRAIAIIQRLRPTAICWV